MKPADEITDLLVAELQHVNINPVSRATGVDLAALSRLKNGTRKIGIEAAVKLLDYFGYQVKKKA